MATKVYQLVAEHYHDPDFGTATAAKMLFMSERSLQRRFKSASSRTLKDYLTEVRLETACEQLLAGEKISEVAFNCGFNDPLTSARSSSCTLVYLHQSSRWNKTVTQISLQSFEHR